MKKILPVLFLFWGIIFGCHRSSPTLRRDFSPQEKVLLDRARRLMNRAYFATLVTLKQDIPRARVMEPFAPDSTWVIWMGTNRLSRKVKEIERNPTAVLHYFDRGAPGYVTLYGRAYIVEDPLLRDSIWRPAWAAFYPDKSRYVLIRFETDSLELIDAGAGLPGDSLTWKPYGVVIRR
ncbi:MAG: pyridoxamine 5'-phosphate oxidase family protein [Chlorobi bacterium]|nr:pyridoxamine 5'-phosphate oxidase family protein [Chlorobiota bacterium]